MTVFMLKPLEARNKKTFGDAPTGGFVIDRVRRRKNALIKTKTNNLI